MTSLAAFVSALASRPGPLLSVYSEERVEFNGPVLARWFSKIANLAGAELGADLFGDGGGGGAFLIRHGLWQEILWTAPLLAMGWRRLERAADAGPGDLLLVSDIDEEALSACANGAFVLAQPREYLSVSWRGDPLPEGVLDSLAEVMAQSDVLEVSAPADAPSIEEIAGSGRQAPPGRATGPAERAFPPRLLLRAGAEALPEILRAWLNGSSVVLVDPLLHSEEGALLIAESEGALLV